jgi:hypothetical protein
MALGEAHVLRRGHRDETVLVVVRPGCVVHHDGRVYGEGELLGLSAGEAGRLEAEGTVERRG